jgi:hypothetical protein
MLHHPEYAHRDKKRAQETKPKGEDLLHNHPRQGSFEPRERIPGMSAEYTPERHGEVSVISASRGGLVKTSHHKYAGRRQEPLATAYRTARKVAFAASSSGSDVSEILKPRFREVDTLNLRKLEFTA